MPEPQGFYDTLIQDPVWAYIDKLLQPKQHAGMGSMNFATAPPKPPPAPEAMPPSPLGLALWDSPSYARNKARERWEGYAKPYPVDDPRYRVGPNASARDYDSFMHAHAKGGTAEQTEKMMKGLPSGNVVFGNGVAGGAKRSPLHDVLTGHAKSGPVPMQMAGSAKGPGLLELTQIGGR